MEEGTTIAAGLGSSLGKDPRGTDNATEADWNIFEAAEDASTVAARHQHK
jgi:hypothetical protein